MKIPLLLLPILAVSLAHADSIPLGPNLAINGPGGTVVYNGDPSISGYGPALDGGSFYFSASGIPLNGGKFASGTLSVSTPDFTLNGALSKIFFNPKTGIFQAAFTGRLGWPGGAMEVYHATFYETINLQSHSFSHGYVVISSAPEPSSLPLVITGLVGITVLWRRKVLLDSATK